MVQNVYGFTLLVISKNAAETSSWGGMPKQSSYSGKKITPIIGIVMTKTFVDVPY